jgi:hypothetical protein
MLANHAPAPNDSPQGDSDYETILTALTESARGRAFLQEFLQRNRSADTASLLTAIRRIEGLLTTGNLEPDQPQNENGTGASFIAPMDNAPLVEAASQAHTVMSGGAESELTSASEALQSGTFAIEMLRIEVASADVAEIDAASVEIAEYRAAAIEYPAPRLPDAAAPADPAAPAERIRTEPRDPFADFYALSNEEKIALFT